MVKISFKMSVQSNQNSVDFGFSEKTFKRFFKQLFVNSFEKLLTMRLRKMDQNYFSFFLSFVSSKFDRDLPDCLPLSLVPSTSSLKKIPFCFVLF